MSTSDGRHWRAGLIPLSFLALSVLAVGCEDDGPVDPQPGTQVQESDLDFIRRSATSPPLETTDTSFWAVLGQTRELEIRFQGQGGTGTGKKFLELDIDDESLLRRPDGTSFALGDSIEIFVSIDPDRFLVDLEPSGLEFNPAQPAVLEIRYDEAESEDLERETEFELWRQESPGDPWELVGSVQLEDFDEIEAQIFGFTRYALAIGL